MVPNLPSIIMDDFAEQAFIRNSLLSAHRRHQIKTALGLIALVAGSVVAGLALAMWVRP